MNDFTIEPLRSPKSDTSSYNDTIFEPRLAVTEIQTTPNVIPEPAPAASGLRALLKRKLVWISGLVILIILGAILLLGGNSFSEAQIQLTITAPAEITTGDLITYTVAYRNNNDLAVSRAKLTFTYPVDAVPVKDGALGQQRSEIIDLGDVPEKTSGQREFTAYITGESGMTRTAQAALTFVPSGLKSELRVQTSHAASISVAPIRLNLVVPPAAVNGQTITYLIDYRNESGSDFSNMRIVLKYPNGFTAGKITPAPDDQDKLTIGATQYMWSIPEFKAGDTGRISIQGVLRGVERESKLASLALQKSVTTSAGDAYIDFEKSEASTVIATPPLSVFLRVNESDSYTAHLGDRLRYVATIKNNSNADITGLIATAGLDGIMYDYNSVRSSGFFDSRTKAIMWNAVAAPGLSVLRPNQSVDVSFEIQLKPTYSGVIGTSMSLVKTTVHIETPNVPSGIDLLALSADDELITRLSTAPTFNAQLTVNDPQWGTLGPFPPRVDQKTVFTLKLSTVNPSNDLKNVKISATLMPGVAWESRTRTTANLPQPTSSQQSGVIIWNIDMIPAGTGISFQAYEGYMQISITPSSNQIGNAMQLIKDIRMTAVDSLTSEQIARTVNDISTSNAIDSRAGGTIQP